MCCSNTEYQNITTRYTTFFFIHFHIAVTMPMSTTYASLITKAKKNKRVT